MKKIILLIFLFGCSQEPKKVIDKCDIKVLDKECKTIYFPGSKGGYREIQCNVIDKKDFRWIVYKQKYEDDYDNIVTLYSQELSNDDNEIKKMLQIKKDLCGDK